MRASARTRVTFVSAKVTKTIRSGTPSFGSPAFLSKAGAKRTRDLQSLKHLFAFSGFPCGTRWCPVAVGALFRLSAGARTAGESFAERARLPQVFLHQGPAFSVIANLAWQGVAIPKQKPSLILRLPQPLTLLRNDMAGISIDLELTTRDSLLARRASQSLAGERSEACLSAASWRAPDRDAKRRVAAGRVSRVPFSFPSFFWASKD